MVEVLQTSEVVGIAKEDESLCPGLIKPKVRVIIIKCFSSL